MDIFVHFVIMTPIAIFTNTVLARRPPAWLREGIQTLAVVILSATIVLVATRSTLPDRDLVLLTLLLVVLFATMMQRLRFRYAVVAYFVAQLFYTCGLTAIGPISTERSMMCNSIFVGAVLFALLGAFNLERESRTSYLLRLRDSLRNNELEAISFRDALTGIGNRHALAEAVARVETSAAADRPTTTSVILLDIDHFKLFNDTNGHQKGDECLRRVAEIIVASLRNRHGVVYRFGGEEFLILLADTAVRDALLVAERIRAEIGRAKLPSDPNGHNFVSISAGISAGCIGRDATADSLISAADDALYIAKREGRDRIWPARGFASASFDETMIERLAS